MRAQRYQSKPLREERLLSYRYVISDLDGTLLNERGELSAYTVEVLRRVQAAGVGVIAASGRLAASMLPFVRAIGSALPIITGNGAVIADGQTGQPLEADCVPLEDALEAAALLEAEGHYFHSYDVEPANHFYCAEHSQGSDIYSRSTGMKPRAVGRLSDFMRAGKAATPKLLVIVEDSVMSGLRDRLRARFAGRLTVTNSTPNLIEITRQGVTKGNALRALCARLNASPAEFIAFGDGGNDESMLAVAGLGVAVRNAQPGLLAAASRVCGANTEDGVAHFLAGHFGTDHP